MPSEAKSSPEFQEVRPAMLPLHSFCQILFPIRSASALGNVDRCGRVPHRARDKVKAGKPRTDAAERDGGLTSAVSPLALQPSALFQRKAQSDSQPIFMKSIIALASLLCRSSLTRLGEDKPAQLKDQKDKFSYAVGLNIGMNFKRQNVEVNTDLITAGFKDGMSGKTSDDHGPNPGHDDGVRKRYAAKTSRGGKKERS